MPMRYARRFPEAARWECAQVARLNAWLRVGLWRQAMVGATRFGDGYGWGAIGLALLIFGGARGTRHLLFGAVTLAVVQLAYNVTKRVLVRARPCDSLPLPYLLVRMPDTFSFPSGHTATAFAMAIIIGHFSALLWPGALLLATLVGVSRLALGAHFPSDVAAGMVLGCLCACLCLAFY